MLSGTAVSVNPPVSVSQNSPAAQTHNEKSDGCEVTLVPHILDVVPDHLHKSSAHKEGLPMGEGGH